MPSLYERLGGEAAIEAAVARFYDKVLGDPMLAPYFEGLDVIALIKKQIAFMTMAFGGPSNYTGRDLRTSHARLVKRGLGDAEFDAVAGHLKATLEDLGVGADLISEVLTLVGSTRNDVLSR